MAECEPRAWSLTLDSRHVTPRKAKFFERCRSRFFGVQIRPKIRELLFQFSLIKSKNHLMLSLARALVRHSLLEDS